MKVTVNDYLYVRVGKPSLNAPNYQYLAPGSVLEVDGNLYDGDEYHSTSKWLKDEAGNYYWAGATNFKPSASDMLVTDNSGYDYWHLSDFGIKTVHDDGLRGQGIGVCVIDSGIVSGHTGFNYAGITTKNFITSVVTQNAEDDFGHGTQCAGVIKANGKKVFGVAYEARLFVSKIYSANISIDIEALIRALTNLETGVSVVSVSITVPESIDITLKKRLTEIIAGIILRGVVVVVSHGNANTRYSNWLGTLDNVISVGAIDKTDNFSNYTINKGACTIYAPGADVCTTDNNGSYANVNLTSFSAPFVASVCALAKQKKPALSAGQIKALLLQSSKPLTSAAQFKKIDPQAFINQIV